MFLTLILVENWKIIKLDAQLFDFNSQCVRKTMNEGLITGCHTERRTLKVVAAS